MYPRIQVNQWNWPIYLADKLKLHWKETGNYKYTVVPFSIPRATDASYHYSRLPTSQRFGWTQTQTLCLTLFCQLESREPSSDEQNLIQNSGLRVSLKLFRAHSYKP